MAKRNGFSLKEIADLSGVSIATVSRVINCKGNIKEETRSKVVNILNSLGYKPQPINSIIASANKTILMNVQTLHNPIASHGIDGAQAAATHHGYQLLLVQSENITKNIDGFETLMKASQASGMLLLDDLTEDHLLEQLSYRIPLVLTMVSTTLESVSSVSIDDYSAAINAINYLLSIGRKKIGLINSSLMYKFAKHREDGYRQALQSEGIEINEEWISRLPPDFNMSTAISAAEDILSLPNRPNAFFAVSDVYAAAIVRACKKLGLSIPDDVAIVGFDNTNISQITDPAITTVEHPAFQIGFTACNLLIDKIQSANAINKNITLDSEIIVRGSTL